LYHQQHDRYGNEHSLLVGHTLVDFVVDQDLDDHGEHDDE
jgi:hypothetical protein